ncbi:MAG TPA: hypothetical protein VHX99_07000 [Rhizomicrobium sp.]|jgi:hypothetical protein|nr:hypothetical protein [Rhizomicrobium sp.]
MRRLVLAFLLLAAPALAAGDPAAAVNDFYGVYTSQHAQGVGIPDATVRLRLQPVLSPRLNKELADAAFAQARLTAKVKNAVPPVLEGDIFSSLFEGASAWKVGACQTNAQTNAQTGAKTARCSVALSYAPPAAAGSKAKPANWTDTVLLVNTPQGWKVDDVVYDAGFAFGNTGRLSEMLAMVIASNP